MNSEQSSVTTVHTPELHDTVSEIFGPYRLMGTIASGGMADLYLAIKNEQRGVSKTLAVKRILSPVSAREEFITLFTHEAKLTTRLEHPNIVRTTDFGEVNGQFYLTMEYLAGEDLQRVLKVLRRQHQRAPTDIAVALCEGVVSALAYAHGLTDHLGNPLHVVHRDVSPSNVMVTYQGITKLIDFGIARFDGGANNTKTGAVRGKIGYLAPECFSQAPIDGRVDIWSVGCLLWELLANERLFRADNDAALMHAVLTSEIPYLGDVVPDIDPALASIVHRCLARRVSQRFASADELGDALAEYLESTGGRPSSKRISTWMSELFGADRASAKLDVASGTRLDIAMPKVLKQLSAGPGSRSRSGHGSASRSRTTTRASARTRFSIIGASVLAVCLLLGGAVVAIDPSPAAPAPAAAKTRVSVDSKPTGAMVFVDDTLTGLRTPSELSGLTEGRTVRVRVEAAGYAPLERVITPRVGEHTVETFVLEKQLARVQLTGFPAAAVLLVDGQVTPVSDVGSVQVPLGQHAFQAQVEGRVVATVRAEITTAVATVSFK